MSFPLLELLVPEMLREVFNYLEFEEVKAVALVSKHCGATAREVLFRNASMTVTSRKQLQIDVGCWKQRIEQISGFGLARRLFIDGNMPPEQEDKGQLRVPIASTATRRGAIETTTWDPPRAEYRPAQQTIDEDSAWRPLVELIQHINLLTDLEFDCVNQFPPCLLAALHQYHPQCRLHIGCFNLRSLGHPESDHYEFALVTSPCLYSITTSEFSHDWHMQSLYRVVSHLAPNLQRVLIYYATAYGDIEWLQPRSVPPAWKGFSLDDSKITNRRGSLSILEDREGTPDLQEWSVFTDIAALRILKLGGPSITDLNWMIENHPFQAVHTLELHVYDRHLSDDIQAEYYLLVAAFISCLPPLKSLFLSCHFNHHTFKAILETHGVFVRHLDLSSVKCLYSSTETGFVLGLISQIQCSCPLLEDISFKIPRSKGDITEHRIYRTLGAMPRLQNADLILDCANRDCVVHIEEGHHEIPEDPSFDEFGQLWCSPNTAEDEHWVPRNGHVRDNLINSAVDETLARAIFQSISSAKIGDHFIPLQSLRLRPSDGSYFGTQDDSPSRYAIEQIEEIDEVIDHISRTWTLKRDVRHGHQNSLIVEGEVPSEYKHATRAGKTDFLPSVMAVVRRLWPGRGEEPYKWEDNWHSFPLADIP